MAFARPANNCAGSSRDERRAATRRPDRDGVLHQGRASVPKSSRLQEGCPTQSGVDA